MNEQVALQKLLQQKFLEFQSKNPRYSLRSFSKKLGMAPSAMSELLRGHRRASRKLADRIATRLLLSPEEARQLLEKFPSKQVRAKPGDNNLTPDYLILAADQFQLISEWTHFAILSLIETKDFQSSPQWIADRLGTSLAKSTSALERLERLGLIRLDKDQQFKRTHAAFHSTDDIQDISLQKAHIMDMELAKQALQDLPVEYRDFTSISVPANPSALPKAKAAIRKFRNEMATLLKSSPGSEVYQMSVYLYPLTQLRLPKGKDV